MEPKFTCTTVETQRDFLEVAYKISFVKNAMWVLAETAGGVGCIVAYLKGIGNYLLPCGIVLLVMGIWGLTWPGIRSMIGYKKALKTYGVKMKPSTVTFADAIINEVMSAVHEFEYEQNDDQTLILIRYQEEEN